jgi:hypothetical protein
MICASVPTAMSAYVLAARWVAMRRLWRQPVTVQTAVSFFHSSCHHAGDLSAMTQSFIALLPVFIVILVGFAAAQRIDCGNHWSAVDHVATMFCFRHHLQGNRGGGFFSMCPYGHGACHDAWHFTMFACCLFCSDRSFRF